MAVREFDNSIGQGEFIEALGLGYSLRINRFLLTTHRLNDSSSEVDMVVCPPTVADVCRLFLLGCHGSKNVLVPL